MFKSKKTKTLAADRSRMTAFAWILLVFIVIYAIALFVPLIWALVTSFKAQRDFRINIIGLPKEWVWNYSFVLEKFTYPVATPEGQQMVSMPMQFLNALLYALGCAFTKTFVPCVTAYLCARFPFKFSKVIYTVVIITMILPIVGSLPAEIQMAKNLGLYDQIWGLWLMKANFLGMDFLIFYGMFKALPAAFTEAAQIDGAGNLTILTRIALPLASSLFLTLMLINFIAFWNDYQTPLIYLPSHPTIAMGMFQMAKTTENGLSTVPMRMTGAMLMLIPIIALFMAFHKRLMNNLTMGGIKG